MIKTTDISLEQVVDCHLKAFPNSVYNLFGRNFLFKVFQWYIDGSDLKHLFVYIEDNKIVGFLTARIKSYKGSFIRYIFPSLFNSLLRLITHLCLKIFDKITFACPFCHSPSTNRQELWLVAPGFLEATRM